MHHVSRCAKAFVGVQHYTVIASASYRTLSGYLCAETPCVRDNCIHLQVQYRCNVLQANSDVHSCTTYIHMWTCEHINVYNIIYMCVQTCASCGRRVGESTRLWGIQSSFWWLAFQAARRTTYLFILIIEIKIIDIQRLLHCHACLANHGKWWYNVKHMLSSYLHALDQKLARARRQLHFALHGRHQVQLGRLLVVWCCSQKVHQRPNGSTNTGTHRKHEWVHVCQHWGQ